MAETNSEELIDEAIRLGEDYDQDTLQLTNLRLLPRARVCFDGTEPVIEFNISQLT